MAWILFVTAFALFSVLMFKGRGYLATFAGLGVLALSLKLFGCLDEAGLVNMLSILIVLAVVFGFRPVRRVLISQHIMKLVKKTLPTIGETEDIALKAGTVEWDGEIFSGAPHFPTLLNTPIQPLSKEEQAFLDGPVEKLCAMLDDEEIAQKRDLPQNVWAFLKKEKFFGMIIPKAHGGLGFSAAAHSAVVTKVSSKSLTAAITVMVPNSLGPGELLLHYGTDAQKKRYLENLACGKDLPCFALTEPHAGSDAANGQSFGVVCEGTFNGKKVLGMKLTFNKRYITLAPVATVVGLAFRLYDPKHLLGDKEDIGITCALLPRETPGLDIGNRHDPMSVPFQNGPVRGKEVFVPLDYIIGGPKHAGNGWRMLMECLSAGRGISLPSLSVGGVKLTTRATTAYGHVREQFGLPISRFEGVRERMARVAAHAYFMDATRRFTCGAVDAGEKPSVGSAIAKAYLTEGMRTCLNDGMDIHAGSAICKGPNNIFARAYTSIPIGITVEGANILTRSLMIFGQGAMRCHPFLLKEVEAVQNGDIAAFDAAFFGHINHVFSNLVRSKVFAWFGTCLLDVPGRGREAQGYRQLARLSAIFALLADVALATLGGALKRKEHLSGHFADVLAWMYIASATLKRYHDEGRRVEDHAVLDYSLTYAFHEAESALVRVLDNLPNKLLSRILKLAVFPFGKRCKELTDKQKEAVVRVVTNPQSGVLEHLTQGIYVGNAKEAGLGALEDAYQTALAADDAKRKLMVARRKGIVKKGTTLDMASAAEKAGVLTKDDVALIREAEKKRDAVVQVSDFSPAVYDKRK